MNYPEAVQYLYSLGNETLAMKLALQSVRELSKALDEPQRKFPAVHIAGTNGKGSTAAMVASIARAAGIRTGLNTSPHLVSITERIRIDGEEIAEDEFARLATLVRETGERLVTEGVLEAPPTFFEQVTMIAYLHFAQRRVDLAVLEVGLGGRLDATNICEPIVTAITPVDFDHQRYLGNTLAEIAGEKAGIIKSNVPVVVAPQADEAMNAIRIRAGELNAPILSVDQEIKQNPFTVESAGDPEDIWNAGIHRLKYRSLRAAYDVRVNLRGRHQITNARTAIKIAEQMIVRGFEISDEAIARGLGNVEWPGRLEMVRLKRPSAPMLLDGAHNVAGATVLRGFLDEHFSGRPITLVFGIMEDKAIGEIARILFSLGQRIIVTRVNSPRAADPRAIADQAAQAVICVDSVKQAIDEASRVTPEHGIVCACGSLYLVGEIKQYLGTKCH